MNYCRSCKQPFKGDVCPVCGAEIVSVADASLDQLIETNSVPDLVAMIKAAKASGAIGPVDSYADWMEGKRSA